MCSPSKPLHPIDYSTYNDKSWILRTTKSSVQQHVYKKYLQQTQQYTRNSYCIVAGIGLKYEGGFYELQEAQDCGGFLSSIVMCRLVTRCQYIDVREY
jgi:hypothetical protein